MRRHIFPNIRRSWKRLEQKIRAHYHIGAEGDVEENEEAATAEGITKEEE